MLRFAPYLTAAVFLAPVAVGLVGTLLPALGYMPAIGLNGLSLGAARALFEAPGFATAMRLTVTIGVIASLASLAAAIALVIVFSGTRWFARAQSLLAPLLAAPHAAIALGLAFVVAPSGWVVRAISPELTGWVRPPTWLVTVRDPQGLAVVVGLMTKEIPYLAIMLIAALGQVPATRMLASARSMGYRPATAWLGVILPQVWRQMRLPFYAVVAYSFSVVDQALVLGPSSPPTLAVLAARWFADYDLALYPQAAAAALLQAAVVAVAIVVFRLAEWPIGRLGARLLERGKRTSRAELAVPAASVAGALAILLGIAALVALGIWSVAGEWPYPSALPHALTLSTWMSQADRMAGPLITTVGIAAATAIALALCIACLENEDRRGRSASPAALQAIYVPLLVPQIAFLFGVQVTLVIARLDGTLTAVVWSHLVFVLPYVFLSLSEPWRALDARYARSAASLGASPDRVLFAVKLPVLLRPILVAAAVGISVSVGQYLPTIFAGTGRVSTITTESLTLATGSGRPLVSAYGFVQAVLPLAGYGLALAIPRLAFRKRRGLL